MHRTTKIKITELNPHVICVLCGGYYINATTITECLHSFCRTCITRYLETSKYCPICDVMVHKTRPLEYIRSDKTLQDLVYKLVPGLYKSEMKRRREYYSQHPGAETLPPSEDRGVEFHDRIIYTEDEKISLSLELCAEGVPFKTPSAIHGHNGPDNIKINDVRYLVCPAAFSVGNLKKFIRMKFDLKPKYEIDIFQTAEPLADFYTLMDIAYIYTWTRRAPLRLYYTVYERVTQLKALAAISEKHASTVQNKDNTNSNQDIQANQERGAHGVKRKYNDGPDDVSFDLSTETPEKVEEPKKDRDIAIPKKKNKKHVDSTVLEAVSKSEEILAKLTLDCSNDGDGLRQNGADKNSEDDSAVSESKINKENYTDTRKDSNVSAGTPEKANTVNKTESPVSLSLFEPLNGENSNVNVYDFQSQEPNPTGEISKTKGKRGRKKKIVIEPDKTSNDKSVLDPLSQTETSLVISDKHPGIKAATTKKESAKTRKVLNSEPKKKGTAPKIKTTTKDTQNQIWKGKTVKEIIEISQGNGQIIDKPQKKRGRKPGSVNKVKKAKTDSIGKNKGKESDESDSKSKESAKCSETQSLDSKHPAFVNNEYKINCKPGSAIIDTDNNSQEASFNATVSPNYNINDDIITPLYGQTPKPSELNPGLPVSLNGGQVKDSNGANSDGFNNNFMSGVNDIGALNGQGFRPYMNGYIPATESSDQPLDLTNNAQRSEYTKGKIFKTKLLKKTMSKSEGMSESVDRVIQNGHSTIPQVMDTHS